MYIDTNNISRLTRISSFSLTSPMKKEFENNNENKLDNNENENIKNDVIVNTDNNIKSVEGEFFKETAPAAKTAAIQFGISSYF